MVNCIFSVGFQAKPTVASMLGTTADLLLLKVSKPSKPLTFLLPMRSAPATAIFQESVSERGSEALNPSFGPTPKNLRLMCIGALVDKINGEVNPGEVDIIWVYLPFPRSVDLNEAKRKPNVTLRSKLLPIPTSRPNSKSIKVSLSFFLREACNSCRT